MWYKSSKTHAWLTCACFNAWFDAWFDALVTRNDETIEAEA
ncbi:hypothetical protein [Legionella pneumophila]|nr:hypothetical protein [Legionella pneumophila]